MGGPYLAVYRQEAQVQPCVNFSLLSFETSDKLEANVAVPISIVKPTSLKPSC